MNTLREIYKTLMASRNFVIGSRILFAGVAFIALLVYLGLHTDPVAPSACSHEGFPGRCYEIDPDVCGVVWRKANVACEKIISGLSLPPGRLSGPIQSKCEFAGIDKAFHYNRKSTAECDRAFVDLDDWVKRNKVSP